MKACVNKRPNARVRVHSPNVGWRGHRDETYNVVAPTDMDLFAGVIINTLKVLGYSNHEPFVAGFFLEAINRLPVSVRQTIAIGVMKGWGIMVEPADDHSVNVSVVQSYDELVPDGDVPEGFKSQGDLVVPQRPGGLVLPHEVKNG